MIHFYLFYYLNITNNNIFFILYTKNFFIYTNIPLLLFYIYNIILHNSVFIMYCICILYFII